MTKPNAYEIRVVVWTDRALTEGEQRDLGDRADDFEGSLAAPLLDAGLTFSIETQGPKELLPA